MCSPVVLSLKISVICIEKTMVSEASSGICKIITQGKGYLFPFPTQTDLGKIFPTRACIKNQNSVTGLCSERKSRGRKEKPEGALPLPSGQNPTRSRDMPSGGQSLVILGCSGYQESRVSYLLQSRKTNPKERYG